MIAKFGKEPSRGIVDALVDVGARPPPATSTLDGLLRRQAWRGAYRFLPSRISEEARQADAIIGPLVLAETIVGMIDPSTTLSPATPRTRSLLSSTASGKLPIRQVPQAW